MPKLPPSKRRVPWFTPPGIRNRKRKAAAIKRHGHKPPTKAEARAIGAVAVSGMQITLAAIDAEIERQVETERALALAEAQWIKRSV